MDQTAMRTEALEWTRNTFTIDRIRDRLESEFDLKLERVTVRTILVDLGVRYAIKLPNAKNKGRGVVSRYDQIVCWLVYVAFKASQRLTDANNTASKPSEDKKSSRDVRLNVLSSALDECRDRAERAVWRDLASAPEKRTEYNQLAWDWRVESVACHLFISDLEYGLEPRELQRLLTRRPGLLNLTLDSYECLYDVLRAYVSRYLESLCSAVVEPDTVHLLGDTRFPVEWEHSGSRDTIEILDQYGVLRAGGPRLSGPVHVDMEAIDIYSEGDM